MCVFFLIYFGSRVFRAYSWHWGIRDYIWWCPGNYMECQDFKLGSAVCKINSLPLYYCSGPWVLIHDAVYQIFRDFISIFECLLWTSLLVLWNHSFFETILSPVWYFSKHQDWNGKGSIFSLWSFHSSMHASYSINKQNLLLKNIVIS